MRETMSSLSQLPDRYRQNLHRAVEILRERGCTEIYLFGSAAAGEVHEGSDLDLAVRGCPKGEFFSLLGKLILELDYPVDLVSLDGGDPFGRFLEQERELVPVD